jgi:hypothetical protein
MKVMFIGVKSTNTPVTPTKKSLNAKGVLTFSLCMSSIKPIVYVVLVYKRVSGWEKLIKPLSPLFSIGNKIKLVGGLNTIFYILLENFQKIFSI